MAELPTYANDRPPQVRAPSERSLPTPSVFTPRLQTPQLETPRIDAPRIDAPKIEVQRLHTPQLAEFPSALRDVASLMDKAGSEAMDVAKHMAREEGVKAVTLDEDGNVRVEKSPIIGDAAISYQRAIEAAAIAKGDTQARDNLLELRKNFELDPEGFRKAAAEFRNQRVKNLDSAAGAIVATSVGNSIDNSAVEIYRSLQNKKEKRDLADARQSVDFQIERTKNELYTLAMGGDQASPEYQQRVQKVGALWGQMAANPRFGVSRDRVEYEMSQLHSELAVAALGHRVEQIQKEKGPEAAVKAAEGVTTDLSLDLTPAQRMQYSSRLVQGIQQRLNLQAAADKGLANEIDAIGKVASEGFGVAPERIADVQQKIDAGGNPALIARFNDIKTVLPIIADWRRGTPAQLEANIARLDETMRTKGASEDMLALRQTGTGLLKKMRDGITADPLTWADRSGAVSIPAVDFAAPNAAEQMRDRAARAETVASLYGVAPSYLKPDERTMLQSIAAKGGDPMLQVARAITEGFGSRAPRVLAEIGKDSPVLAHLGGLTLSNASPGFLRDAADAVALRQNPDFKHPRWLEKESDVIQAEQNKRTVATYGNAFVIEPETGRAAEMSAKSAFYTRSARIGFDPKLENRESQNSYDKSLQEAAGAVYNARGVRFGGVDDYATGFFGFRTHTKVLIPATVREGRFGNVIGALRDEDVAGAVAANGKPYTARDFQNAAPVAVRGGYRFAAGDPTSDDPKWIRGADGRPFVLDIGRLEPKLRSRVPDAFASF
jgi:hypothetical protein